jgi:hypothetical protein
MHDGPVIVNNTPLVALWTLRQFDLLQSLFQVSSSPHRWSRTC